MSQAEDKKLVFHQNDIWEMDVIPDNDVQVLLQVIQQLLDEKLFKVVHDGDGMGWKIRTVEEARKYASLLPLYTDCPQYSWI